MRFRSLSPTVISFICISIHTSIEQRDRRLWTSSLNVEDDTLDNVEDDSLDSNDGLKNPDQFVLVAGIHSWIMILQTESTVKEAGLVACQ